MRGALVPARTTKANPLEQTLISRFQATRSEIPDWAWPLEPSIPLVGRRFRPGKGVLVYASAENLTWMNDGPTPSRFKGQSAWNRYRICLDTLDEPGAFFPNVGIQPVTNGGLLAAALFVAEGLGLPTAASPRAFVERIAVSNWCKFSIQTDRSNKDPLGNLRWLTPSLPFVVGELAELRPAVVLLPKAIWDRPILAAAMRGASPRTSFLPVPQFNATVVNCHLGEYHWAGERFRGQSTGTPLAKWMANLQRLDPGKAWRYLALLEELCGG